MATRTTSPKPQSQPEDAAYPPETLEGWYAVHQIFSVDRRALRELVAAGSADRLGARALGALRSIASPPEGWSTVVRLVGSGADVMFMHFRPTLEELSDAQEAVAREPLFEVVRLVGSGADVMFMHFRPTLEELSDAQEAVAREPLFEVLRPVYSHLSVTEAGLYHITAKAAKETLARGGAVGDEGYAALVAERARREGESAHVQKRLYPPLPADLPYVSFYPMSKRRDTGQNWYTLPLEERSRLMYGHGLTGRRYAGEILQVVTGSIGLSQWEWGVTLFGRDPLQFKKLVTEMRFDEVTAKYAEFGEFYVGKVVGAEEWVGGLVSHGG